MDKKYVRKSFWVHQYEKEEEFLSDMRSKGWKFVALHKGIPTKYEFDACEPEEYSYCLDYVKEDENCEDYHQLYKDAEWEEVMSWDGINGKWYYFCKKNVDGKKQIIYTDQESKLDLMNKLVKTYGFFFLMLSFMEVNAVVNMAAMITRGDRNLLWFLDIPLIVFCSMALVMLLYFEGALFLTKNKLKKQISKDML